MFHIVTLYSPTLFLPSGSYTIQGRRVRVYQPEFEECWASGLVSQHDPISHIMEITIDKVKRYIYIYALQVDWDGIENYIVYVRNSL